MSDYFQKLTERSVRRSRSKPSSWTSLQRFLARWALTAILVAMILGGLAGYFWLGPCLVFPETHCQLG